MDVASGADIASSKSSTQKHTWIADLSLPLRRSLLLRPRLLMCARLACTHVRESVCAWNPNYLRIIHLPNPQPQRRTRTNKSFTVYIGRSHPPCCILQLCLRITSESLEPSSEHPASPQTSRLSNLPHGFTDIHHVARTSIDYLTHISVPNAQLQRSKTSFTLTKMEQKKAMRSNRPFDRPPRG